MGYILSFLLALVSLTGTGTTYAGEFVGHPVWCSRPGVIEYHPFYYTQENLAAVPWVALPIEDTSWTCGDLILVRPKHYAPLLARALDAGPLGLYMVNSTPILVDIPTNLVEWTGISAKVSVANLEHVRAELARMTTCKNIAPLVYSWPYVRSSRRTVITSRCHTLTP